MTRREKDKLIAQHQEAIDELEEERLFASTRGYKQRIGGLKMETREILFRAWCPENAEMYWPDNNYEFVFDNYSSRFCPRYDKDELYHFSTNPSEHELGMILMQFAGVHDKKGVKVFEGDILRVDQAHNAWLTDLFVVTFVYGSFGMSTEKGDIAFRTYLDQCRNNIPHKVGDDGISPFIEVIGNIHQNPELL